MLHFPVRPAKRLPVLAVGAIALLLLSGCTASNPDQAAEAAAAKPLSQAQFIARQLTLSSSDFGEYLRQQSLRLSAGTAEFSAAYASGDTELAKALYAPTRVFYNRMLAASASFPELDAALDTGDTGWRAVEADLWPASGASAVPVLTAEERQALAQQLDSDTQSLSKAVSDLRPTVAEQAAGVAALMSGRASAATSGTIERYSHTDLYDLQGYLDGSREAFSGLRPILVTQNAALATTLDHRFDAAQGQLNALRTGVSFPGYDTLGDDQTSGLQSAFADLASSLAEVPSTLAD